MYRALGSYGAQSAAFSELGIKHVQVLRAVAPMAGRASVILGVAAQMVTMLQWILPDAVAHAAVGDAQQLSLVCRARGDVCVCVRASRAFCEAVRWSHGAGLQKCARFAREEVGETATYIREAIVRGNYSEVGCVCVRASVRVSVCVYVAAAAVRGRNVRAGRRRWTSLASSGKYCARAC